jgi:hypothetical protein
MPYGDNLDWKVRGKGSRPAVRELRSAIPLTCSGNGCPVRRADQPQCGLCTSCRLRRLSLFAAGLREVDQDGYGCDLYSQQQRVAVPRLKGLWAMEWQAERLQGALRQSLPAHRLLLEFPELRQVCVALSQSLAITPEEAQGRLVRLYSRHCQEWAEYPFRTRLLPGKAA